jgi:hypothetical protein
VTDDTLPADSLLVRALRTQRSPDNYLHVTGQTGSEIQRTASRLITMVIRNMDVTQQIAIVVQRLRHIFFDIHMIEITDDLHMLQIVFFDIATASARVLII